MTVPSGPPEHTTGEVEGVGAHPVDLRDYVRFDPDAPVRVRVLATDVLSVELWCLEPQQDTGVLQYPDSDVTYTVLGGYAWIVTDEGEIGLGPLGAIMVTAGTAHGLDNRAADPLVVLACAAPPAAPGPPDTPVASDGRAVFTGGR